jgi:hypothetical protein
VYDNLTRVQYKHGKRAFMLCITNNALSTMEESPILCFHFDTDDSELTKNNCRDVMNYLIENEIISMCRPMGKNEIITLAYLTHLGIENLDKFVSIAKSSKTNLLKCLHDLQTDIWSRLKYDLLERSELAELLFSLIQQNETQKFRDVIQYVYLSPYSTVVTEHVIDKCNTLERIEHILNYHFKHLHRSILSGV